VCACNLRSSYFRSLTRSVVVSNGHLLNRKVNVRYEKLPSLMLPFSVKY
jgi:hypothetical protein